jgi:hypothetical protein
VNHQIRIQPSERSPRLFTRPEFVGSLTVTTLSSIQMFDWWRRGDMAAIRTALFGLSGEVTSPADNPVPPTAEPPKHRLFDRRPRR